MRSRRLWINGIVALTALLGALAAIGCGEDGVTLEAFNRIEPGDTKADVVEELGEPETASVTDFKRRSVTQWHYCQDGTEYTITLEGDDVVGSQYANRRKCGSDPDDQAATQAQSERDQLAACIRGDADADCSSLKSRREALRACVKSPSSAACQELGNVTTLRELKARGDVGVVTPKLLEACAKATDGVVIDAPRLEAPKKKGQIAELDLREFLSECRKALV